jgi:hypothetical protein
MPMSIIWEGMTMPTKTTNLYSVQFNGKVYYRKSSRLFTHAVVRLTADGEVAELYFSGSKALAEKTIKGLISWGKTGVDYLQGCTYVIVELP